MVTLTKPTVSDLSEIEKILSEWTDKEEVEKYSQRIRNEINGKVEFNTRFWVAKEGNSVLGVAGLSDPLPKTLSFAKTNKPVEIKILYVDGNSMGKGVGKNLIGFLEEEIMRRGYKEILVRSAKRYKLSAWGFYKRMDLEVGELAKGEKQSMQVFSKILL